MLVERTFFVEDRGGEDFSKVCDLLDALGWDHYPTNVTGEEIDAGDDSDAARDETVEVPSDKLEVYDFLDEMGVWDC